MIPFCRDQGLGVSVFSPLARGLLTGDVKSTRNQTDFFTQQMYSDEASFEIAHSVQRVARRRGVSNAQIAQSWVANHPGVDCMLVGADTTEQFRQCPRGPGDDASTPTSCTSWSATTRRAT